MQQGPTPSRHFRRRLSASKMSEDSETVLQLPAAAAAAGGESLAELSPETATPEPPSSAAVSPGTEEPPGDTKKKIDILLKAVGDTPIMKTKKWAVERTRTIQGLIDFIKKFLKLVASEQLFIYVNQSFAPSPDQEVGTLYECFGSDGKLVLHYCKSQAWG
ncbi:ubiquitin-like protein ATG12 isoform X1 [Mastomys coucha]|uniref:ubiquitin-like protein ATG12 isoform X1 n=1 Tax=Mastomys coucha TaxID=35658 RepID=UPI00126208EC|nr:ubiquitin-like protein ATG12 isoform X1 [Mastomys coucha]